MGVCRGRSPIIRATMSRSRMKTRTAFLLILFLGGCGKAGTPHPPVPIIPKSSTDLLVAQRGPEIVLSWSYPSLTTAGGNLQKIKQISVHRYTERLPASLAGRDPAQLLQGQLAAGMSREAALFSQVPLVTSAQFAKVNSIVDTIEGSDLPSYVAGAKVIYADEAPLQSIDGLPVRHTYAVTTVGDEGRSDFSNLISIVPLVVPTPPGGLRAEAPGAEVVLSWSAPTLSIIGTPTPSVMGYNVYRFPPEGAIQDLGSPINAAPVVETTYKDSPPYGKHRYAATAVAGVGPPLVQSEPTPTILVEFRDHVAPPSPSTLVPLVEQSAVRLLWDPIESPDFAGYKVYRFVSGRRTLLTKDVLTDSNFRDPSPTRGVQISYGVSTVDVVGNESAITRSASVLVPRD